MRTRLFLAALVASGLLALFTGFTGPPQAAPGKHVILKDVHVIAPATPVVVIAASALDALDSAADDQTSTQMFDMHAASATTTPQEVVAVLAPRVAMPYASAHS